MTSSQSKLTHIAAGLLRMMAIPRLSNANQEKLRVMAVGITDVIAQLTAERELRERAEAEVARWRDALQGLTPLGSEFTTPEACVVYVRGKLNDLHEARKAVARLRKPDPRDALCTDIKCYITHEHGKH